MDPTWGLLSIAIKTAQQRRSSISPFLNFSRKGGVFANINVISLTSKGNAEWTKRSSEEIWTANELEKHPFPKKSLKRREKNATGGFTQCGDTPSVYLRCLMIIENDLDDGLKRRRRAAWTAFGPLKEATGNLTNPELRAYLFDATLLTELCYAAVM